MNVMEDMYLHTDIYHMHTETYTITAFNKLAEDSPERNKEATWIHGKKWYRMLGCKESTV